MSVVLFLLAGMFADVPHWPGFLGAGATAASPESIPLTWSPTQNMAWKSEIPGYGQSSPVVWNDRVFVTSVDGENKETLHVVCYSLKSGERLWDYSAPSKSLQKLRKLA